MEIKIKDMPKLERDEKGRFVKGISQNKEFLKKSKENRAHKNSKYNEKWDYVNKPIEATYG